MTTGVRVRRAHVGNHGAKRFIPPFGPRRATTTMRPDERLAQAEGKETLKIGLKCDRTEGSTGMRDYRVAKTYEYCPFCGHPTDDGEHLVTVEYSLR